MRFVSHQAFTVRYDDSESHALLAIAIEEVLAESYPDAQVVTTEKRMGRDVFFAVVSGIDVGVIVEDGVTGEPIFTEGCDGDAVMVASVLLRKRFDRIGAVLRLDLGPSLDPGAFLAAVDQRMKDDLEEADRTPTLEIKLEDSEVSFEEIPRGSPPPTPQEVFWG